jgi:hypothetical protein
MTNTNELTAKLKAAAQKATPGEWWSDVVETGGTHGNGDDCMEGFHSYAVYDENNHSLLDMTNSTAACITVEDDGDYVMAWDEVGRRNAEFIALANPTNILALTEALEAAQSRIAELEARTLTVKLPDELYAIGELIRTQDNRITDQPMFVVFQKREIIGSDEHSPSRICWVWEGEEVSELRAKRLESLYQDCRDTRGYDRYAMQEVDEFVTACFTEQGCKNFLRQNGHNLRLPYIYACGSFRNNEYQLVRNWLAGIKLQIEGE